MKRSSLPYKLLGLEALSKRLSAADLAEHRFLEKIRIVRAGVNGEKALGGIFEKYIFKDAYAVFQDLNLKSSGLFQIDTLFLSGQGATILEVKNIAGRIQFPTERNQLVRTLENGQVDAFECPSVQLERNKMLLGDWFQAHGFDVPIRGAVVFSTSRQRFENTRDGLKIIFPLEVPVYLQGIMQAPSVLDTPTLDLLTEKLLADHREYNPFPIAEKYNINSKQIKTGIRCNRCGLHGMIAIYNGWICKSCRYVSQHAYKQAIIEYFMLFGGTLTNKKCRDFLHLSSADKTIRLIRKMKLPFSGENKGRRYELTLEALGKRLAELEDD